MDARLRVDDSPDGLRTLTLANLARQNAIDDSMLQVMDRCLSEAEKVRAWLIVAEGSAAFCSGYDLNALARFAPGDALPDDRLSEVFDRLMRHPAPSVACVTGVAIGAGCDLAMACDFRVGNSDAVFGMPPSKIGLAYSLPGLRRLTSRIGDAHARFLLLSGRRVDSATAFRMGLLTLLETDAEAAALGLCKELVSNAPMAVSAMKLGLSMTDTNEMSEQVKQYHQLRRDCYGSRDFHEGRSALIERRSPTFEGR